MAVDEKVRKMIRWNDTDPTAMLDQLQEQVRNALKDGKTVGVVVCSVVCDDEEGTRSYDIGCSPLPVEVIVLAGEMIIDKAKYEWKHGQ